MSKISFNSELPDNAMNNSNFEVMDLNEYYNSVLNPSEDVSVSDDTSSEINSLYQSILNIF